MHFAAFRVMPTLKLVELPAPVLQAMLTTEVLQETAIPGKAATLHLLRDGSLLIGLFDSCDYLLTHQFAMLLQDQDVMPV